MNSPNLSHHTNSHQKIVSMCYTFHCVQQQQQNASASSNSSSTNSLSIVTTPTLIVQSPSRYLIHALPSLSLPHTYTLQQNGSSTTMEHSNHSSQSSSSSASHQIGSTSVLLAPVQRIEQQAVLLSGSYMERRDNGRDSNLQQQQSLTSDGSSIEQQLDHNNSDWFNLSTTTSTNGASLHGRTTGGISGGSSLYTNHFLFTNSLRALREIRGNEWLSEFLEKWPVRDAQAFYVPPGVLKERGTRDSSLHSQHHSGSGSSMQHSNLHHDIHHHEHQSQYYLHDSQDSPTPIVSLIRMDTELALWMKVHNKWLCFGRYKATRLNQQSSQQRSDQEAIIWACGENSFQYDFKVMDNLIVVCYGAIKESQREAFHENTHHLEEHHQPSTPPYRTSPVVLSQKGLLGIIMYDLNKVHTILERELLCQKRDHTHSKYVLQRPESHRIIPAHDSSIVQMRMSPNGKMVATASARGTLIRLVDTITGQVLIELRRGRNLSIMHSIGFSPSSRYLCCTSSACTMHLFDIQKGLSEGKKSSASSSWFSIEGWLGKEVVSTCKYKELRGHETMCMMPDDSTVYIINNVGDLLHLEFDPKQKDHNQMLRLVSDGISCDDGKEKLVDVDHMHFSREPTGQSWAV
eukprot:CAMPEP_0117443508 /NCGR_PEP_ID=MMETSP0759-20121206/4730_1 /TAXON_ID=63605 /ORGANISM="Percolomonas cosmopolitus, Strain WS" /LENGTH=630 /DNA_ID=CAMNT_0005235483 /DNA_START=26 /DNA_END=1919 /DNA_ORIENTATION=+